MADETNGTTEAPAPAAGAQQDGPPLQLLVQYLKDLSFENPGAPQTLQQLSPAPSIEVDLNVESRPLQERVYEVVLTVSATAKRDDSTFFVVELSYAGVVAVGAGVPNEHLRPLVMIEGPRMIFPFARRIVADCVRDGGFPPLLINPIDFAQLFRQSLEREAARQGAGGTPDAPTSA